MTALSGRPAPPKQVHRSAVPGDRLLVGAFFLLGLAGASGGNGGGAPRARLRPHRAHRRRDPARPVLPDGAGQARPARPDRRAAGAARPGPLPGPLGLGPGRHQPRRADRRRHLCPFRGGRYGNVLDYAGPNLASNQLIVYTPNGPYGQRRPGQRLQRSATPAADLQSMATRARGIAAALGSRDVVELESTSATLQHAAAGRSWSGPLYVATPQLLRAFGINASAVDPDGRHPHHAARAVRHLRHAARLRQLLPGQRRPGRRAAAHTRARRATASPTR